MFLHSSDNYYVLYMHAYLIQLNDITTFLRMPKPSISSPYFMASRDYSASMVQRFRFCEHYKPSLLTYLQPTTICELLLHVCFAAELRS